MIKVMVAGRRKAGMTRDEMHRHALMVHAKLVQTCPGFWQHCHRYVQNHIIGQVDFETGTLMNPDENEYDVLSEFWFDSIETAMKAWSSDDYFRILKPDEQKITDPGVKYLMLFTTEHLIGGSNPTMSGSPI
jgi:uncharacterized protein (TIGR02118 family)